MKSTNNIDRESILKQILWDSAEHYLVEEYSRSRISKGKLAEMLDMNIYEVNDLLDRYHIKGNLSFETFVEGVETAESLSRYDSKKTGNNNE